jgi:hypothetical protein
MVYLRVMYNAQLCSKLCTTKQMMVYPPGLHTHSSMDLALAGEIMLVGQRVMLPLAGQKDPARHGSQAAPYVPAGQSVTANNSSRTDP